MTASVVQRCVEVRGAQGLHARPAAEFARAAASYDAEIQLGKDDRVIDAKSVLLILTLDVRAGDHVSLSATGPAAAHAVADLAQRLEAP